MRYINLHLHYITLHYQNCNFRKFKMADGHQFENSFISISQPLFIRFRSNLVHRCKFSFRACKFDKKKSKLFKFEMADGRHVENRFLAISRRHIVQLMRISERRWRITCIYRSRDENGNFRKFRMANGRRFKNSFISIMSVANYPITIKFGMQMQISILRMAIWQKSNFFKFKMADGRHVENRFWLYLGAILAD